MSFLDFAISLRETIQALDDTRERESIIIGQELIALVRRRVQNDKVNSSGSIFGVYTPRWAKVREKNNLQSDAPDFTFTGELFKTTGVTGVDNTSATTTVQIGGQTPRAQNILLGQEAKYGNIIEPNEQETQFVIEAHEERVFGIIDQFLG